MTIKELATKLKDIVIEGRGDYLVLISLDNLVAHPITEIIHKPERNSNFIMLSGFNRPDMK